MLALECLIRVKINSPSIRLLMGNSNTGIAEVLDSCCSAITSGGVVRLVFLQVALIIFKFGFKRLIYKVSIAIMAQ